MNDLVLLKKYCQPLSVLYVEDEKELNAAVVRYLSKFFGHVESAYDGKEGFEKYSAGAFDIVLTDINMPQLNGHGGLKPLTHSKPSSLFPPIRKQTILWMLFI